MTRAERERLIERYLSGDMTSTQESDFFIQVALDKELRQDLKAQRTIESAFRKDRESEPSQHTALRSRMASALAASPAAADAPRGATYPRAAAENAPAIPRAAGARFMSRPMQWMLASAAALALTIGVVLLMSGGSQQDIPPVPAGVHPSGENAVPATGGSGSRASGNPASNAPNVVAPNNAVPDNATPRAAVSPETPPASVTSDGVRSGSAAQAPRRGAHVATRAADAAGTDAAGTDGNANISPTRRGAHAAGTTQSGTDGATQPDGNAYHPSRPHGKGTDSIDVGARVLIRTHP